MCYGVVEVAWKLLCPRETLPQHFPSKELLSTVSFTQMKSERFRKRSAGFAWPTSFDDATSDEDKPVRFLSVNISGNVKASFSVGINLFLYLNGNKGHTSVAIQ